MSKAAGTREPQGPAEERAELLGDAPDSGTADLEHASLFSPPTQIRTRAFYARPRLVCAAVALLCAGALLVAVWGHLASLARAKADAASAEAVRQHEEEEGRMAFTAALEHDFVTADDELPLDPALPELEQRRFAQARGARSAFGQDARYSVANQDADKIRKREHRFEQVQAIRAGHCGRFEEHLAWVRGGGAVDADPTNWRALNGSKEDQFVFAFYSTSLDAIRAQHMCRMGDSDCKGHDRQPPVRSVCETAHPWREGYTLSIERMGSFNMAGGYDWANVIMGDACGLISRYRGQNFSVAGGMFAPTFANGTIIGYPPVHIHHAHLYPYGIMAERLNKTFDPWRRNVIDPHHVLVQGHGDSECKPEFGGVACLYREILDDNDTAYTLWESESGLSVDLQLNNVLDAPLDDVFVDIVVAHKLGAPQRTATYLHVGNGLMGHGFATFDIPADPSVSVLWFKYESQFTGRLSDFHAHAHQTMLDSMFLVRGKGVHAALEPRRRGRPLPLIADCDADWAGDLDRAKREMLAAALAVPGAELVCEVARPSVLFDCAQHAERGDCLVYDKAMDVNCVESARIDVGDELTVVAFEHTRRQRWVARNSTQYLKNLAGKEFALKQHAIFRMTLVYDTVDVPRNPPAFFNFCSLPTPFPVKRNMPGPHVNMTRECPASISFVLNRPV